MTYDWAPACFTIDKLRPSTLAEVGLHISPTYPGHKIREKQQQKLANIISDMVLKFLSLEKNN